MAFSYENASSRKTGFNFVVPFPLDSRFSVEKLSDLKDEDLWNKYKPYVGLVTYVKESKELYSYVYEGSITTGWLTDNECWQKIGGSDILISGDDIETGA